MPFRRRTPSKNGATIKLDWWMSKIHVMQQQKSLCKIHSERKIQSFTHWILPSPRRCFMVLLSMILPWVKIKQAPYLFIYLFWGHFSSVLYTTYLRVYCIESLNSILHPNLSTARLNDTRDKAIEYQWPPWWQKRDASNWPVLLLCRLNTNLFFISFITSHTMWQAKLGWKGQKEQ